MFPASSMTVRAGRRRMRFMGFTLIVACGFLVLADGDAQSQPKAKPAPKVEPTPLDKVDPPQTPAEERAPWHPKERVAVLGSDRGRHWKAVECVAYRLDGKQLASGGADSVVRLWDAATLKQTAALEGHAGTVTAV